MKNEKNKISEITIKEKNKIEILIDKISSIDGRINRNYILLYKGDQLLDENKRVSSYNITPSDILTYKSSREGEFSVFFTKNNLQIEKLVTAQDKIDDILSSIRYYFATNNTSRYYYLRLIYDNIELDRIKTLGDYNITENARIIVEDGFLQG